MSNGKSPSDPIATLLGRYGLPPDFAGKIATNTGQAAPATPATPALKPGDPGWSLAPKAMAAPTTPAATVTGPRPGERGFDITSLAPSQPAPAAKPGAKPGPAKPMTKEEAYRNIAGTNAAIANREAQDSQGRPMMTVSGKTAADPRLAAVTTPYEIPKPKTAMDDARDAVAKATTATGLGAVAGPVAAGWIPGQHTVQRHPGFSEAEAAPIEEHLGRANEAGAKAQLIEEANAKSQGVVDAAYAIANQYASQTFQDKVAALNQHREDYVKANLDRLQQLTVEANMKLDEKQWYRERGTLGAIAAGISIGLGQFGALMRGGENNAYTIINNGITRNINGQMQRKADARAQFDQESNLYQKNLAAFKDEGAALSATKVQYLENVKTMLDAEMQKNMGNPMAQANGLRLREKFEKEQAEEARKLAQMKHTDYTEAMREHFGMFGGAGAGAGQAGAHAYSEELEKAGIPSQLSSLTDIDRTIDTFGQGEIPGVGAIKDHVPTALLSKEGAAARQAFQSVKLGLQHQISGSAINPNEKADLDVMLKGAYDADSLRRVVQSYRQALVYRQKNIAAGHKPQDVQYYEDRGGPVRTKDLRVDRPTTPYQRPIGEK